MAKRILITGASGQLGFSVVNRLHNSYNILATDLIPKKINGLEVRFTKLDISDSNQIANTLSIYKPNVIINLAANTDVDGCEINPEKAYAINTNAVNQLLANFDGQFVHISTDYVFDGNNGPYSEESETNPLSTYGKTKLESENIISIKSGNWCIIRTNVLFDYYSNTEASFIKWIIDSLEGKKSVKVVNDQWNNPTWTKNLAEVIELILQENVKGLYNYGGADYLTRFDFAKMIAEVFNLDSQLIKPVSTKSLDQVAPRPLKGGLKMKKIEQDLSIKCQDLRYSIQMIKSRLSE